LLGKSSILFVNYTALPTVRIGDSIINTHIPQIKRVLYDFVGVGAVCAIGNIGHDIVIGHSAFAGDVPLSGVGEVFDLDVIPQIVRGLQQLIHELLHIILINPCGAKPNINFRSLKVFGLCGFQSGDISSINLRLFFCILPGNGQLVAHISRQIFICCLPAGAQIVSGTGFFENNTFQCFSNLFNFTGMAHEGRHKIHINTTALPHGNCQRFAGRVHGGHDALLLDGSLGKHIGLALKLPVFV